MAYVIPRLLKIRIEFRRGYYDVNLNGNDWNSPLALACHEWCARQNRSLYWGEYHA